MDEEVKGPDPEVWGVPSIDAFPSIEDESGDVKGPDPEVWTEVREEVNQVAFSAVYDAEVAGAIITKGPDPEQWS